MSSLDGRGFFVDGSAQGVHVEWLLDSGCRSTLLSWNSFMKIPEPPLLNSFMGSLVSADGKPIHVYGQVTLWISVRDLCVQHDVIVADISNEGLIGSEFMETHEMVIDFGRRTVWCGSMEDESRNAGRIKVCRISARETVCIPAASRMIINSLASEPLRGGSWLLEATDKPPGGHPLLVARCLIKGSSDIVPTEILNPTEEDVILYEGSTVGTASRVEEAQIVNTVSSAHKVRQGLPKDLMQLLENISSELNQDQHHAVAQLLEEFSGLFATKEEPFGHTTLVQHEIDTGDHKPIKQSPRRLPMHMRDEVDAEVQRMAEAGVIEESSSPWSSPIVLVRKKDQTLRFCLDYRKLNAITRRDSYPLPRIDDSLDALGNAQWFSTLDLASGYWQIGLSEDAKEKSAFCLPGMKGLWRFKVMPFGLTNAPATFQRLMERVLTGLQWHTCLVYIDDIIIFSQDFEGHVKSLREVFKRLEEAGLKLKAKKCSLFQSQVKYLGYIVGREGLSTDPEKTAAIENWPCPQNITEVRSFMGLCSYYRRFVPNFASIAKPLARLTEKNAVFRWLEEEEKSWSELKKNLMTAPVLSFPDPHLPFILDTDASDVGIGAVLSQRCGDGERVVAYGSRMLTKQERRYSTTRRELLAVVFFVKYFRHYLFGRKFTLRTDHASLQWLRNFKSPEGQVARWLEVLECFDFEFQHRPGIQHGNADALSRSMHAIEDVCAVTRGQIRTKDNSSTSEDSNWLSSCTINLEDLKLHQMSDPTTSDVLSWLRDGERPEHDVVMQGGAELKFYWGQFHSLNIWKELLVRELPWDGGNVKRQIIIPAAMRNIVLQEFHSTLTGGHFGLEKTLTNLARRFLWYGMRKDCRIFVRACTQCAQYKSDGQKKKAGVKGFTAGYPMERIFMDLCGPFPESRRGNKYILVVTDSFTKFVEAYALPNQESETVASVLTKEFISRFGVPAYMHSDQGRQFESNLFAEVCILLGIQKTRTTPFHPQSDGQSERNIKTLTRMIAMVTADQEDWDVHLPFLTMAYRATPHASSGFTPNYLMFGREVAMPVDVVLGAAPNQRLPSNQYAKELRDQLERSYILARDNLKEAAEVNRALARRKVHGTPFASGDVCWMVNKARKKGLSPKLQPKWMGPVLVLKALSDVVYLVKKSSRKVVTVHFENLKECSNCDWPSWLKKARSAIVSQ